MIGTSTIFTLPAPPPDGNLGVLPPSQIQEHHQKESAPVDKISQLPDSSKSSPVPSSIATHTRTIGIIYPPTDIRNIVDKTAQFVAKNGIEFEKRIVHNNAGNAKFNFLTPPDPYHAYYQHRLAEFRSQNQSTPNLPSDSPIPDSLPPPPSTEVLDPAPKPDFLQFKTPRKVLEPPEAEQYTVRLPEGVTGEELDIVKLTAQFVARNGKSFLTGLTSREINNPQFHFLKPTHSMFMFFTALADAYSKVLMPPKGIVDRLRKSVTDMTTVLERCLHRLEWEHSQEQARQKAEDEIEQERVQMAMIDWHDFVVVETIDFVDDEDEDLPNPMTVEEVIRRSKIPSMEEEEDMNEPGKEVEMEMDEEEVQFVEEGMRSAHIEDNPEVNNNNVVVNSVDSDAPMRIVKNWKRPEERLAAERDVTKFVVSPITGEFVTINEMSEHMRISLIDPKYKEQKERMFAKIRETTLAHDDEISRNIVGLARTRPDIFGTTEEEVSNAVKAEIEKKDEQPNQVIWDGHSGSIGRTANQAMSNNMFGGDDQGDGGNNSEARMILGPSAPPPPRPGFIPIRPMPIPPGMPLNVPRVVPLNPGQFPPPPLTGQQLMNPPRPPMVPMSAPIRPPPPPPPPMGITSAQQSATVSRPLPMPPSVPGSAPHMANPPPPPGSQFTHLTIPRPFVPLPVPPPPAIHMIPPPPLPQGIPPPPPPEDAPPLPDGPEPKRPKLDDSFLIPEDQFLAKHLGPICVCISVPNTDEGNMKGQVLDIMVQSLSETVGSLKEKIAGETQLPANKQKLSGRAGFLKDNMSLAHYNVGPRETLTLSLRERGGRKR